jgi:hypothetical protein
MIEYYRESGGWLAADYDVVGWGRTRKEALADYHRERRGFLADVAAGIVRDQYGYVQYDDACACPYGAHADKKGRCRICGGHD